MVATLFAIAAACSESYGEDVPSSDAGPAESGVDAGDASALGDGASSDAPIIPDGSCTPATCAAAGGTCVAGACEFACGADCTNKVLPCPAGSDCRVVCAPGACTATKCAGGRSCSFQCSARACASASCESARCTFECGDEACPNITCDAGISCDLKCTGNSSCDEAPGIGARAGESCAIACLGSSSCGGGGGGSPPAASVRCNAPDASIVCGSAADTCKDAVLYCAGGKCTIDCQGPSSCEDGYCCEAGICTKLGVATTNRCP